MSRSSVATVVLARKYRPRNFAQMVGQEHVVRALSHALASRRLHHAYLFTGTRGIGKTTVSRILAKSLNCTGPDGLGDVTAEPCGVCSACREIDADRFIDYIELDAASNRGIDEARDLIERAAYKPSVGRYKVFMIDEAHQLTKDAFNALLKTLEEPPEYLKFVLATTDPEKMLPTVLSRCLQFNLRPMAPDLVREHLARVLEAEGVPADAASLRLLGQAARGSMRDALSLTDQAIAFGGGQLEETVLRGMLGAVDRSHAVAIVQALARRDGPALLAVVDGLRERGQSPSGTLEELARLLQQMAVAQSVPGALDAADPEAAQAIELAAELAPDETQLVYSIALQGRAELALMDDEYAALTMVLLRLFAFPPQRAPGQRPVPAPVAASPRAAPLRAPAPAAMSVPAPARPAPAPVQATPDPVPAATAAPERPAPAPAIPDRPEAAPPQLSLSSEPTTPGPQADGTGLDLWAALVKPLEQAGAISALARELAWQAGVLGHRRDAQVERWHLLVDSATLRDDGPREKLTAALAAARGHAVQLEINPGTPADSLARREAAERARMQAAAEALIRNDDAVRELLGQFPGARWVPQSIKPLPTSEGT